MQSTNRLTSLSLSHVFRSSQFILPAVLNGASQNGRSVYGFGLLVGQRHLISGGSGAGAGNFYEDATGGASKPSYVHPLSQIVLEHLQTRGDWVVKIGLDRGLTLNSDGTFQLKFPSVGSGGKEGGRIWTSYEPVEKKHWLNVHKGDLVGQFMLQDNLKPAWHSDKRSTPEKVQDAVDEMINKISE